MTKLYDAINEQVSFELESAYIYLNMASYLDAQEMSGMTHFMNLQAKEEIEHAQKLTSFLQDVGYQVTYRAIDPGKQEWNSFVEVFQAALDHERIVTANFERLVKQAREEENNRAINALAWFVDEQVEEEDNFTKLVTKLERAGDNWGALYILDGELKYRQ